MDSSKGDQAPANNTQKPLKEDELTAAPVSNNNQSDEEHLTDSLRTVVIADEPGKKEIEEGKDEVVTEQQRTGQPDGEEDATNGTCPESKGATSVKDENGFVYYKCRFCGLTFNFMTTLKAHERVHDVMQPYLCNKCGEAFHFMCELEYHAKQHLKQKGYKCDCGRTFYQYTDLLYHRHPGEDPVVLPLPADPPPPIIPSPSMPAIDPAAFPTPEYMEKGFEPKHPLRVYSDTRTKPYICQYCSKSYSDSRQLAYHMYSHRGERMFNPRSSRYLMCRNENSYMSPGADV